MITNETRCAAGAAVLNRRLAAIEGGQTAIGLGWPVDAGSQRRRFTASEGLKRHDHEPDEARRPKQIGHKRLSPSGDLPM